MQVLHPSRLGIWRWWFLCREKNWRILRKTLGARQESRTTQARIKLGQHWWEARALTTAPSLLLDNACKCITPLTVTRYLQEHLLLLFSFHHPPWAPKKTDIHKCLSLVHESSMCWSDSTIHSEKTTLKSPWLLSLDTRELMQANHNDHESVTKQKVKWQE